MTQRIDELSAPPEIGARYLVPMVFGRWNSYAPRFWPVIGPRHNDRHCLNFAPEHYHLDARFMPAFARAPEYWRWVMSMPLITSNAMNPDGLPEPEWRPAVCKRLENPTTPTLLDRTAALQTFQCLRSEFEGRQARHDGKGWVCPHRNVPLASQRVVKNIITCPLHLLQIDATTGIVVGLEVAA